jgi:Methyltransferase domain
MLVRKLKKFILGSKMKQLIVILLIVISLNLCANQFPYEAINDLPFDGQGWFGNAVPLGSILSEKKPKTVIEVGSWLGSSTRFIANLMEEDGKVYAIDTWKGSPSEAVHMQDPRLPYLFQLFLSNVKHAGLTHKIIPIRMESLEAAKAINIKAELIYLDAAHDTENVVQDILAWYPHLMENGTLCGDDWNWGSVRVAVIHCAGILGKQVYAHDNFWFYY